MLNRPPIIPLRGAHELRGLASSSRCHVPQAQRCRNMRRWPWPARPGIAVVALTRAARAGGGSPEHRRRRHWIDPDIPADGDPQAESMAAALLGVPWGRPRVHHWLDPARHGASASGTACPGRIDPEYLQPPSSSMSAACDDAVVLTIWLTAPRSRPRTRPSWRPRRPWHRRRRRCSRRRQRNTPPQAPALVEPRICGMGSHRSGSRCRRGGLSRHTATEFASATRPDAGGRPPQTPFRQRSNAGSSRVRWRGGWAEPQCTPSVRARDSSGDPLLGVGSRWS